jgi:long-subunit fatty acid transport protein
MKKSILFLTMLTLLTSVPVWAAPLQNTDSQAYELQIQESGRSYSSQYRIIENAQVEICFNGCAMTMLATGQTVQVNPNDSVVIDSGVMSVTAGN